MTSLAVTLPADPLFCRMYEQEYPADDDLVMAEVVEVSETGATCQLLEYGNRTAYMASREFSRKRIRSLRQVLWKGQKQVLQVLRVDKDKGYIDLSKKLVTEADSIKQENTYQWSKIVHGILRRLAEVEAVPLVDLYTQVAWPLYSECQHPYIVFQRVANGDMTALESCNLADHVQRGLVKLVMRRMQVKPVRITAEIEVTCFGGAGIEAIKSALLAGKAVSNAEYPLEITIVAAPVYSLAIKTVQPLQAKAKIEEAMETIEKVIKSYQGGAYVVQKEPELPQSLEDRLEVGEDEEN